MRRTCGTPPQKREQPPKHLANASSQARVRDPARAFRRAARRAPPPVAVSWQAGLTRKRAGHKALPTTPAFSYQRVGSLVGAREAALQRRPLEPPRFAGGEALRQGKSPGRPSCQPHRNGTLDARPTHASRCEQGARLTQLRVAATRHSKLRSRTTHHIPQVDRPPPPGKGCGVPVMHLWVLGLGQALGRGHAPDE